MAESQTHKKAKAQAAGKQGKTEVPIKGNRRLDAITKSKATEIERSGNMQSLSKAARRLQVSHKTQKVLQVPQKDMSKAAQAMQKVGVKGTVKSIIISNNSIYRI